jgi:hypothetical protein
MMKLHARVGMSLLICLNLHGAPDPDKALVKDLKQTDADVSRLAHETKADVLKRTEAARAKLEDGIAKLQKKSSTLEGSARTEADKKWELLRRLKERLDRLIRQVRAESGDHWGRLKSGVDRAMKDLENAYDDLAKAVT